MREYVTPVWSCLHLGEAGSSEQVFSRQAALWVLWAPTYFVHGQSSSRRNCVYRTLSCAHFIAFWQSARLRWLGRALGKCLKKKQNISGTHDQGLASCVPDISGYSPSGWSLFPHIKQNLGLCAIDGKCSVCKLHERLCQTNGWVELEQEGVTVTTLSFHCREMSLIKPGMILITLYPFDHKWKPLADHIVSLTQRFDKSVTGEKQSLSQNSWAGMNGESQSKVSLTTKCLHCLLKWTWRKLFWEAKNLPVCVLFCKSRTFTVQKVCTTSVFQSWKQQKWRSYISFSQKSGVCVF